VPFAGGLKTPPSLRTAKSGNTLLETLLFFDIWSVLFSLCLARDRTSTPPLDSKPRVGRTISRFSFWSPLCESEHFLFFLSRHIPLFPPGGVRLPSVTFRRFSPPWERPGCSCFTQIFAFYLRELGVYALCASRRFTFG